jgi:hypothetical protein
MNENPKNIENKLPIPIEDDSDDGAANNRLIQGTLLRCIDGRWSDRDGVQFPTGTLMLCLGTTKAVQHWQNKKSIETITTRPLPDVELLNGAIAKDLWELGIDGKPRPPWVMQHVAYLLDLHTPSVFTFCHNTNGAEIAVDRLRQTLRLTRLLRGPAACPVVKLDSRPFKTGYGMRVRPEFMVTGDWRELGVGGLENKSAPQLEHKRDEIGNPVKPPTTGEILDDELPF